MRAAGFPEKSGPARDAAILKAVASGAYVEPELREVGTAAVGHVASFGMTTDAFQLGTPGDSVRMIFNHQTAQAVADMLGYVLPTPLLVDAASVQADAFLDASENFWPKKPDQTPINTTTSAEEHSAEIDAVLESAGFSPGPGKMLRGPWKVWANHFRLLNPTILKPYGKKTAINYGAPTEAPVGVPVTIDGKTFNPGPYQPATPIDLRVWQPPGAKHDVSHDDSSQKLDMVARPVWVKGPLYPEGATLDIEALSMHPVLWPLVSAQGPIPMHHPWLPRCSALDGSGGGGSCVPPGPGPGTGTGTTPPAVASRYDWGRLAPAGAIVLVAATYFWTLR